MIKEKIKDSIISGTSIIAVVMMAIVALLLQNMAERWVTHTMDVKFMVIEVYELLQGTESNLRGYLLTSDTSYIQPFDSVKEKVDQRLDSLAKMTPDDPRQHALLVRFTAHCNAKYDVMTKTYEAHKAGEHERALEIVNTNAGESLMDKIEELRDEMLKAEDRLLYERRYANLMLQRISLVLLVLASLLAAYSLYRLYKRIGPLIADLNLANENLRTSIEVKNEEIELRKQAEEKNGELIGILTAKNAELNHFAYIASHDLQEPLRTVNNFIEVFKAMVREESRSQSDVIR